MAKISDATLRRLLTNRSLLDAELCRLSEASVERLLKLELDDEPREVFVIRIHQRLAKLRTIRERAELLATVRMGGG